MSDEVKATEAPEQKASEGESLIDNRRAAIENSVITENSTVSEPKHSSYAQPEEVEEKVEEKAEVKEEAKVEEKLEVDPLEKIKNSVQKRIDKVVAQKKSAEQRLAEAEAEIERLKSSKAEPDAQKDNTPPTPEQVEAYIVKMREEGNVKEEVAAMRYLVKLEKELALKEVRDEQTKTQKEADAQKAKVDAELKALANDYVVYDQAGNPDPKNDMTLSNKNGLLFKTAMSLYNDVDLHKDFYNDPNVVNGFRRAVADAYREIHQQGLIKTPKGEVVEKRNPRMVLAEPTAETVEETQPQSNSLSDAEKVREEIKARNKNRFLRKIPQ